MLNLNQSNSNLILTLSYPTGIKRKQRVSSGGNFVLRKTTFYGRKKKRLYRELLKLRIL